MFDTGLQTVKAFIIFLTYTWPVRILINSFIVTSL